MVEEDRFSLPQRRRRPAISLVPLLDLSLILAMVLIVLTQTTPDAPSVAPPLENTSGTADPQ